MRELSHGEDEEGKGLEKKGEMRLVDTLVQNLICWVQSIQ